MACAVVAALALAAQRGFAAEPPMRLDRLTFVASTEGTTELLVQAESGVVDDTTRVAALETVHAEWTDAEGRPSLEIRCEQGELALDTNDLLAVGDVRGLLGDGRRFRGPWLRYDRQRGVAFTDEEVEIIDGGRILTGGGFEYYVRTGRLRLTGGAVVRERP